MGKPTIVLVHGAFAESASWNGVIADLLGDGFRVIAVANPLRGLASDSEYLRAVLAGIDGEIICVGHSYGGCVISNGATGNTAVRALVFVGGFAPDAGESAAAGRLSANRGAARRLPQRRHSGGVRGGRPDP